MGNNRANLAVPAGWSQQDRRFGESLKQNLDVLQGQRGDKLDRAVTFRDLLDSGIVVLASGVTNFDGNSTSVTLTNAVPNLDIPPAPTSLAANGAFQNIILSWDLQLYGGHSHVEVWRHTSDSISSATLAAQVSGFTGTYADPVGSGSTFYYWVRAVNQNDIVGPYNASAGTIGQTAPDVTHLLNTLSTAITESELAQNLESRIDLIDAAATVTNSVAYRVAQEASARATAITAEATARATAIAAIVSDIPIYDSTEAYAVDQIVRISNTNTKLYLCIQAVGANSSVAITDTAYWKLYGDYAVLKSATDSAAADITEINTIETTSTSAAATAIKALQTSVNDPSSGLSATAGALSTLQSAVNNSETGLSATVTDLTSLETALFTDLLGLAAWSNTANYAIGARVSHLQKAYKATQASTSSAPKTPGVDTGFWALDTIAYSSAVSALSSTLTDDYVEATDFTLLSTDVYEGAFGGKKWDSSTSFALGDTVIHQGVAYKALQNNSNSAPPNSNWELSPLVNTQTLNSSISTATSGLATATDLTLVRNDAYNNLTGVPTWSSSTSYSIGDRVVHTDSNNATKIYKAKLANSNSNPSQNLTGSNPKWQLDPSASSLALSELSSTLTSDYTTSSAMNALLATKEVAGTAAGLIQTSEATAASTYATVTNTDAQYAAIFTEMTGVADWSSSTSYTTGARVIYESGTPPLKRIYRALQNSQNRNPASQTAHWQLDTLAYAAAVSSLDATVNANGTGLVDKVDGVELRLDDVNGNSTNITMEQRFTAQANEIGDLEAQYTVKVDANGYVSGFGLANTVNNGTPTSEFFVNADRFAILPDRATTADPAWASGVAYANGARVLSSGTLYFARTAHTSSSSNAPPNTSYWVSGTMVPFSVQATGFTAADGTYVPPGVYMNSAMIKHAAIEAAQIGSLNADVINAGFIDADRIQASTLDASKLILDGATMTSQVINGIPTLIVNELNANVLTSGVLNTSRINLDSATITANANGQIQIKDLGVDTLQIKGQAVTIPTSAYTTTEINNTIAQTVTWTSTGATTFIAASWTQDGSGNSGDYGGTVQIKYGSTVLWTQSFTGQQNARKQQQAVNISFTPSAGSATVTLVGANTDGTYKMSNRSLFALETKK